MDKPVTEQSNEITYDLDVASPSGMVKMIHEADKEVFNGWKGSTGLYDDSVQTNLHKLKDEVVNMLKNPSENLVVLSGCGTSGRLAFMSARTFNNQLKENNISALYDYTIAGHDIALFKSQEAPEDKPLVGIEMLKEVSQKKKKVLLIGITCGLSAPFVAGQLDYAMSHLDVFTPVLLGFNPLQLSRNIQIEKWDKTFLQVAQKLKSLTAEDKGFILNPIIGPEPITGSSRMKSGSATKILLETLFTAAHQQHLNNIKPSTELFIQAYESVQCGAYSEYEKLGGLITAAGNCLRESGRIFYLATGDLGILGMLDASECTPTFGSAFEDIRGFIDGGFTNFRNKQGDISQDVQVSTEYFMQELYPTLTDKDLVIFFSDGSTADVLQCLTNSTANTLCVHIHKEEASLICENSVCIEVPWNKIYNILGKKVGIAMKSLFCELVVKYICNVVSTGAHTLLGKVFHNYMVDVKVSNNKLYYRAISMIQNFTGCSENSSEDCLLRSIYSVDTLTEEIRHRPISAHVDVATFKGRVVPIAMVLSLKQCSIEDAANLLDSTPVIRTALKACLQPV